MQPSNERGGAEIAVIGMAGRFPGANSVDELWENLRSGVESVSPITLEEWAAEVNTHPSFLDRPDLVRFRPRVEGVDLFDAAFFGFTPREAEILDPQQRLFLECSLGGARGRRLRPDRFAGLDRRLRGREPEQLPAELPAVGPRARPADGRPEDRPRQREGLLATRVAYKLNLRGAGATPCRPPARPRWSPSTSPARACSAGECDMALAGGGHDHRPAEDRLPLPGGGHPLPGRPLPGLRRRGAGARSSATGSACVVLQAPRRRAARRRHDPRRHPGLGGQQRRRAARWASPPRASTGQAEVIVEALAAAGVDPDDASATSRPTAPAPRSATRSRSRRSPRPSDAGPTGQRYCAIGSVKTQHRPPRRRGRRRRA